MPDNIKKEKASGKKPSRYEKQLRWIFVFMLILIVIVAVTYFFIQSLKKFSYGRIDFQEIKYDKLQLFYSRLPVYGSSGELIAYYNLYLRGDPRKNNIPVNAAIKVTENSIVTIDPSIEGCPDNGIAAITLSTYLAAAKVNITYASTDEVVAKERKLRYIACDSNSKDTIIMLKAGNSSRIFQQGNCYTIQFKNCEIINATERFIVSAIANSQGIQL